MRPLFDSRLIVCMPAVDSRPLLGTPKTASRHSRQSALACCFNNLRGVYPPPTPLPWYPPPHLSRAQGLVEVIESPLGQAGLWGGNYFRRGFGRGFGRSFGRFRLASR